MRIDGISAIECMWAGLKFTGLDHGLPVLIIITSIAEERK